jgi:hypothetical protein
MIALKDKNHRKQVNGKFNNMDSTDENTLK